ncbi:Aspartate racemase [Quillaja saponaria]|nr:Aspartate racemase [Quillaja saponaria]
MGKAYRKRAQCRAKSNSTVSVQTSSALILQTDGNENSPDSKKIWVSGTSLMRCQTCNIFSRQPNTVGVIGGVSVLSTLIFLEKLVWWSSRNGEECLPFVVCSDPVLSKQLSFHSPLHAPKIKDAQIQLNHILIIENLLHKRAFLEQSGAHCLVMPCHLSHAWHSEISEGCSLPFLHVGDCVAMELKKAKLKPLEAGSNVRIGVLATDAASIASCYQDKLSSQGFEVVVLDRESQEHTIIPAMEALNRRDREGARNLLRIAIQVLLVRAVNFVILACDEMQGLLPHNDPLLKKCIDPMDALARSTIKWAKSTPKLSKRI